MRRCYVTLANNLDDFIVYVTLHKAMMENKTVIKLEL